MVKVAWESGLKFQFNKLTAINRMKHSDKREKPLYDKMIILKKWGSGAFVGLIWTLSSSNKVQILECCTFNNKKRIPGQTTFRPKAMREIQVATCD